MDIHRDSEEESVTSPREPPHYTLCFGSSGWLFTYYFGVIKCFKQYGIDRNFHCIGCSGGALACAAGLCTDNEVDDVKDYILACADEARASFAGPFKLRKYILGAVDLFCSGVDDYKKVNGKVEVSITKLPLLQNVRVKEFTNHRHMVQSLLASSCMFPLAGLPVWVDGVGLGIDGAVSDLQLLQGLTVGGTFSKVHNPVKGTDVQVSICPFYCSRADIKPSRYLPPWWVALPPSREQLEKVYRLGYSDACNWLKEHRQSGLHESWADWLIREAALSRQSLGEYVTEQLPTLKEHAPILEHIVESLPTMPAIIPDMHLNDHFAKLAENLPTLLFNEAGSDSSCLPACMSGFMEMDPSGPLRLMVLLLRQILVSLAAILVYTELVLLTLGWGLLTYTSLWLPGHSKKRQSFWKSFTTYFFCTFSPRLAIRTVPVVGRALALDSHAKKKLEATSFMYRFLSFLIE